MAGTIEIFNMALGQIGSTETVMDLNERSLSLQTCVRYWNNVRDSVLSDFPWSFATKQQQLGLTTETPVNWLHQYLLPADCLRVQRVVIPDEPVSVGMLHQFHQNPPYELMWSEAGTVLKCDQNPCLLQYTMRIEDDSRFPPEFASMVSLALAANICIPLKSDATLAGRLEEQYKSRLASAQATALNQQQDFPYNTAWQGEFRSL